MNVLTHYQVITGQLGATAASHNTFIGNEFATIRAKTGGFAEIFVKIGDDVIKGQKVALQRNAFGDVVAEYSATVDGKVLSVSTDVTREHSASLVRILANNPAETCKNGC